MFGHKSVKRMEGEYGTLQSIAVWKNKIFTGSFDTNVYVISMYLWLDVETDMTIFIILDYMVLAIL